MRISVWVTFTLSLVVGGCANLNQSLKNELRNNPSKAIEFATEKLKDNPNQVSMMSALAYNHHKLGNYHECLKWSDQALRQIPNHVPVTLYKIKCHNALNQNELATQLEKQLKQYTSQRYNEYVAANKRRKRDGLGKIKWWVFSSPFATGPGYPKHVHRANISGCASVEYRINAYGKVYDIQISNEYPKGFLTDSLNEFYNEVRLKPTKHNPQRVALKQRTRWRFNPSASVNRKKYNKYCND